MRPCSQRTGVRRILFDGVAHEVYRLGLMSDEHFSMDGTLIEAAASIKSFKDVTIMTETTLAK